MARIITFAVLLCPAVALIFSIYKNKGNPNSVYAKALLRIKSVRVFPVISLAYAFFAVVIVAFGLLVADEISGYDQYFKDDDVIVRMHDEKMTGKYAYPLITLQGREPAFSEDRPKILVIGDSFVWGHGLTNINQIWWSIMSSELERRGYDCEVYAIGYQGLSTYDELCCLRDTTLIEDIQPDLIILDYCSNDPDLASMGMEIKFYSPVVYYYDNSDNYFHSLYPNLYCFLGSKLLSKLMEHEKFMNRVNDSDDIYSPGEAMRKYTESPYIEAFDQYAVQPLGALMSQLDIPMIVIPIPAIPEPEPLMDWDIFALHVQKIMPLFESAGLRTYDPFIRYSEYLSNGNYYKYSVVSPVNRHPGPATSWFFGGYAADIVEQEYASILGEKRTEEKAYSITINDWMPFMLEPQAIQESGSAAQYTITYPAQGEVRLSKGIHGDFLYDNFLTKPLHKKYVKLNFKYPVKLSSVKIEGENLLSAEVWTLAINHKLGFDDQKPVSLGKRRNSYCVWADKGKRDVTSLLISAKTVDGKQAALTVTIEGEVA